MDLGFTPKADEVCTYSLVNKNVEAYLSNTDYSSDSEYNYSDVSKYRVAPVTDQTQPLPVVLEWKTKEAYNSLRLMVSEKSDFTDSWNYNLRSTEKELMVYNLIPNKKYYWKVLGIRGNKESVIKKDEFYTLGQRRFIHISGDYIGNCRDLGGLACGDSKIIHYGKLFRGAELLREDGGPYMKVSGEGITELHDRMGCTVELDFGDLWEESPLEGKGFEVYKDYNLYGFYGYDREDRGLTTTVGRKCLHNCLVLVVNKLSENKSIYFHCNSGADRTGTFAFIIEALCGVSDDDKSKDYELTSLWAFYYKDPYNRYTSNPDRFRNAPAEGNYGYKSMIKYINNTFKGDNLNEKVFNMCISPIDDKGLGIDPYMIAELRSLLINDLR